MELSLTSYRRKQCRERSSLDRYQQYGSGLSDKEDVTRSGTPCTDYMPAEHGSYAGKQNAQDEEAEAAESKDSRERQSESEHR